MEIILAQPRGFCAGVDRAIDIVLEALRLYGAPVYVRHEIVHNKYVVEDLKRRGAVFVKELDEIPDGAITIFSAHGVSDAVEDRARLRGLPVIDATCPLVTKVHNQARRDEKQGREVVLIGHAGHPEVVGTSGRVKEVVLVETAEDVAALKVKDAAKLSFVTQTTLSVNDTKHIIDALRERFPLIAGQGTKDICYATQNRQDAVAMLAQDVDILLVVGAGNSSNSNRLRDLGEEHGVPSYLIDDASKIQNSWFDGVNKVGLTAGASAPEVLVNGVIEKLKALFDAEVILQDGIPENVHFRLPPEVRKRPFTALLQSGAL